MFLFCLCFCKFNFLSSPRNYRIFREQVFEKNKNGKIWLGKARIFLFFNPSVLSSYIVLCVWVCRKWFFFFKFLFTKISLLMSIMQSGVKVFFKWFHSFFPPIKNFFVCLREKPSTGITNCPSSFLHFYFLSTRFIKFIFFSLVWPNQIETKKEKTPK